MPGHLEQKKTNKKVEILKLVLLLTVLQTVQVRRWNYLFYISKTLGKDFSEPYPGKHKAEIKKKKEIIPEGPFNTQ